ncbi:hypothetical protein KL911_003032 [Ogataea haglerorum]|uniref:uncharacterized protein n=1 Tax=Ogataea haglerorum TaxID=1937702 RepID=UPI001C891EB6|nr:uncharacterized protein KL911_003032 [Ogataea haglerorum]KAG7752927.1 hypothetical protein KL911_003032 [Ogataea haglerorum]
MKTWNSALLKERAFDCVRGFERRAGSGGLWNYHDSHAGPEPVTGPSLDPHSPDLVKPCRLAANHYVWPSAIYELLDTNVPRQIMEYSGFPFPKDTPLFPTKQQVLDYMKRYAKDVEPHIRFNTNVVSVRYRPNEEKKWLVTYRPVCDETEGGLKFSAAHPDKTEHFDAVLVASGHYELPYVPEKKGLAEWTAKYPGSVSHSKHFRHPRQFADVPGNLLIVGNSASALDLAYQTAVILQRNVYKSARSQATLPGGSSEYIKTVPDIDRLEPETRSVRFTDGSVLHDVGHVLFATGFLRHYPFLDEINRTATPVVTDGLRLHGLYKQCVSYNFPGLAFIATPRYILPTRVGEAQAVWLSKIFQGKLELHSIEEMKADEENTVQLRGDSPKFHNLMYPDDVHYAHELNRHVYSTPGWQSGLLPCEWNREDILYRASAVKMKEAYLKYRERTNGKRAASVEELQQTVGFKFEDVDWTEFKLRVAQDPRRVLENVPPLGSAAR